MKRPPSLWRVNPRFICHKALCVWLVAHFIHCLPFRRNSFVTKILRRDDSRKCRIVDPREPTNDSFDAQIKNTLSPFLLAIKRSRTSPWLNRRSKKKCIRRCPSRSSLGQQFSVSRRSPLSSLVFPCFFSSTLLVLAPSAKLRVFSLFTRFLQTLLVSPFFSSLRAKLETVFAPSLKNTGRTSRDE